MAEKESKWIKFYPSLELPKERVSIAYDTHDERGYRFAYGYFQFYNGTCGCFWKDGNEQPKVVKTEDIKYWMPIPSLDVQEESKECMYSKDDFNDEDRKILCDGCEEDCKYNKKETVNDKLGGINNALVQDRIITSKPIGVPADAIELVSIPEKKEPVSEDLEEAAVDYGNRSAFTDVDPFNWILEIAFKDGAKWQKEQLMASGTDVIVHVGAGNFPYIPQFVLYDYDKDVPLAKEGDKYKVILIKED